jgi:transposase
MNYFHGIGRRWLCKTARLHNRGTNGVVTSEVAERLGIGTKSLYTWKAQFSKPPHVRAEVLDQAAEIRRLKRELARVTEERTILKKATAYFARESQ